MLALALPSVAPALVVESASTDREADLTWSARWDGIGFAPDVFDDASRPRVEWAVSDPLHCAVRHDVLDGFRIEGVAGCVADSGAWRRFLQDDPSNPQDFGADELFRLDATVELVAELGDRRTGRAWRVGLGGGWSRAESVLGTGPASDGGSMGLVGFLADDLEREGAGTDSDASGEGVVWLRFSRAF